ncbi:tyrosine-type recombinase/integrase [Mycobacterium kyogaense]|uniref:tyrosine-type recombinase/integrase n=1 Tax=Mycobacterium kyogaense TaxID=2212479 RepID=UPI0013C41595|nr:tyrosine-type recombinase/integrase [Mycobacterium kyogaense]
MSGDNEARIARARATRAGLRLSQRRRLYRLIDATGTVVHSGSLRATTAYLLLNAPPHRPPGPPRLPTPRKWKPAIDILLAELVAARRSPATIELRVRAILTYAHAHPGSDPRTVTRAELAHYIGSSDFSARYAHNVRSSLRIFFDALQENEFRDDNPAARLPKVRIPRSLPRPCPDGAILHAIQTNSDPRVALAIRIAAETGLRRAEIARIKRSDVEGWPGSYSLRVFGKGGHERTIPLGDDLARTLREGDTVHVFSSPSGGHLTANYLGKLIGKALPDNWTTHTMRHRFATKAYQHSGDIRAVQELMGHNSPTTTAIYTQVDDTSRRVAAAAARITFAPAELTLTETPVPLIRQESEPTQR